MPRFLLSFFAITSSLQFYGAAQKPVTVTTSQGTVVGYREDLGSNTSNVYYGSADVFLGIPYAQPPVENLRFQKPQSLSAFPENPYNATYYRDICPQLSLMTLPMSEDCLHLNIMTPNANSTFKYPVMLWIHGGGLLIGHAQTFWVKGAIRNLVSRGVVVVTIQYRLGLLGFFTTLTDLFPPNLGMLDQVEAIRWVSREIASFGGDPYRITLFGESAGAASVSAHTYSPLSQNLFQQAIMESGTILTCFEGALGYSGLSRSRAKALCNITYDQWDSGNWDGLETCMQSKHWSTFLPLERDNLLGWKMTVDDYFMPNVPRILHTSRPNIPVLIGSNKDEWENDTRRILESVYADPDITDDGNNLEWLKINNAVFTTAGFTGFIAREIDWYLENGNQQVYLYEFTQPSLVGQIVAIDGWQPVPHAAEIPLLWMSEVFENAISTGQTTAIDFAIANFFGKTWTDFAIFGRPMDDVWKPTSAPDLGYYEIRDNPGPQDRYRPTDRILWNDVIPALVGEWPPAPMDNSTTDNPATPTITVGSNSPSTAAGSSSASSATASVTAAGSSQAASPTSSVATPDSTTTTASIPPTSPSFAIRNAATLPIFLLSITIFCYLGAK